MTNFEKLTRPFAKIGVTPPRRIIPNSNSNTGGPVQITVQGSASAGAQIALTFATTAFTTGPQTVTFTLGGGDTLATATEGIVAAINANAVLAAFGIVASIVPAQILSFVISQPTTLLPQASVSGSTIGTIAISFSGGTIQFATGRRGQVKALGYSHDSEYELYNKKWPKETTKQEALAGNVPTGYGPR